MALIKNSFVFLTIIAVAVAAGASTVHAARGGKAEKDALWSVSNSEKKQIVPSYTGGDSPFPINIKNAAELKVRQTTEKRSQARKVVVKRSQKIEKVDNSKEIGELLKKIHKVVAEKQAYNPDVSTITIDGRIDSTFGAKVLIYDRWFSVGENVLVSIMQTDELIELIDELHALDGNLAEIVSNDLKAKMEESKQAELVLTKIGKDFVELEDSLGKKHVISFVINSL